MAKVRRAKQGVRCGWARDLRAVHSGDLDFDAFFARHQAYIERLAAPWVHRCPASVSPEDVWQEVRITLFQALASWNPAFEVPIDKHVKLRIRFHLLRMDKQYRVSSDHDRKFLDYLVVEEKIVYLPTGRNRALGDVDAPQHEHVSRPLSEMATDAKVLARVAVMSGKSARAQDMLAKVIVGMPLEEAVRSTYGKKLKRPKKAGYRAIANAIEAVESSCRLPPVVVANENNPQENTDADAQETALLRPLRKVRQTDAGQGEQVVVAG